MKLISTAITLLLLTFIFGYISNLPQDVGADVPQGKLNSLSYAPFHEGQSPMTEIFPSEQQISDDLQLLSNKTFSIRTYASAEGTMPTIPALARKHGLTMIQGAWLGGIEKGNQVEINELIRSANANPDVIKRVIVGNEVLLRGDLPPEALIKAIRTVKKAVKQPVSYADVWSMYMKYPEIINEVDFITIHILPYWEDEPIAVNAAPAHIERIYHHVQEEARKLSADKPILIGESGWPSVGKQRGLAIPSVSNEARFIRGLITVANTNHFDYNIVEAINQSWKSNLEGVVGANWGLLSIDRKDVFPLTGKVYEHPHWLNNKLFAGFLFITLLIFTHKALRVLPTHYLVILLSAIQLSLVCWCEQIDFLWATSYSLGQHLLTGIIILINAALGFILLNYAYTLARQQAQHSVYALWGQRLYAVCVLFALMKTLSLAINGRYISFPTEQFYLLITGISTVIIISFINKTPPFASFILPRYHWLGRGLILSGIALIIGETSAFFVSRDLIAAYPSITHRLATSLSFTLSNNQLVTWLSNLGVLALPYFIYAKTNTTQAK